VSDAFCARAEVEVLLYGTGDGTSNRACPQRLEQVDVQFLAFFVHQIGLTAKLLAT
jgi:hypothetical protein